MLKDKNLLITGVATRDSIATATVIAALELGANVLVTAAPRDHERATQLMRDLRLEVAVDALDLTEDDAVEHWVQQRRSEGLRLDGVLHAVAYAPQAALTGRITDAGAADTERAFRTSVWTYARMAKVLDDLRGDGPTSLVGLDFDAGARAWPVYNWMGACKAALRDVSRYVARDFGASGMRSNLVAAGPLRTRAALGIPNFDLLTNAWATTSPLTWDDTDARPVADVVCFLMSDLARAISGEVIHVDGGYHAMATPMSS